MKWNKAKRLLLQSLSWMLFWGTLALLVGRSYGVHEQAYYRVCLGLGGILIVTLVNYFILLPFFYVRGKHTLFFLLGGGTIFGVVLLTHLDIFPWSDFANQVNYSSQLNADTQRNAVSVEYARWVSQVIPLAIVFVLSSAFEIIREARVARKRALEGENEKLNTELKFLKSQINPHFLFNCLNNIYSLSVEKSELVTESIMQLSEILKYVVYDSNDSVVSINDEIRYLNNYIGLIRLSSGERTNIELSICPSVNNIRLPPLLFIPFVENAVKHSAIQSFQDAFITIDLSRKEDFLVFKVVNTIPSVACTKDQVGGVGLSNVKKRLDILYEEGNYAMNIAKTASRFIVELKIKYELSYN